MTDPRSSLERNLALSAEMLEAMAHIGRAISTLVPALQEVGASIQRDLALIRSPTYNEPAPAFPPQAQDGREIVTESAPAGTGVEEAAVAEGTGPSGAHETAQTAEAVAEPVPVAGAGLDVDDLPESLNLSQHDVDSVLDNYGETGHAFATIASETGLGSKTVVKILSEARKMGDARMKTGDAVRRANHGLS